VANDYNQPCLAVEKKASMFTGLPGLLCFGTFSIWAKIDEKSTRGLGLTSFSRFQ
jgi:hypothetical protein